MEQSMLVTAPGVDFKAAFEAMPGSFLILQPNAPDYTILAISDELLKVTGVERDKVTGKNFFEVFPENLAATTATGPSNLRTSLQNAIQNKEPDQMPVVRYDIFDAAGEFEERYWSASNKPVLDKDGQVLYIILATSDITRQVKAEKEQHALREIERTYNLFMQAPVAVGILSGPDYIVDLANDEILRFLGRSSDIIGKPLFEAVPEAINQGFQELLDRVRKSGQPVYTEEYATTILVDGREEVRYYDFVNQPYYKHQNDKQAAGVFSVGYDVTEQVTARKKLAESEHRFRSVTEELPIGTTLLTGKDLVIEVANNATLAIWGRDKSVIGMPLKEAIPELAGQPYLRFLEEVYATGIPYQDENAVASVMRDGVIYTGYFDLTYKPMRNAAGEIYGVLIAGVDVTDRILQEQKFRNVVEQATDMIAIFKGDDLVVEVANHAMLHMWQVDPEVLHQPFRDILPEMAEQGFTDLMLQVLHTGEPYYAYEAPAVFERRNGTREKRYFNFRLQPYREVDGSISGVLIISSDVTDQMATKQQLIENEHRYRTLIDEASVATALYLGKELQIKYVNEEMLRYWGKDSAILDKTFREALPELIPQSFPDLLDQVYTTGKPYIGIREKAALTMDGITAPYYFNFTYKPLRNKDGEIYGIHHMAIDVTEEVLAHKRIEESEARFRSMVQQAPVAITLTLGPDHILESINAPMLHILGKQQEEEVLGCKLLTILPELKGHPILAIVEKVLQTGEADGGSEVPVSLMVDGQLVQRYFTVSYSPLLVDGKATGVLHVANDVTEQVEARKKIEDEKERARLAIEVGQLGVFELDYKTNEMKTDQRFNTIFGFNSPQDRDQYLSAFHPDDLPIRDKALEQSLITGSFEYESRISPGDQQVRWVKIQGRLYWDALGEPARIVGVVQDITEHRDYAEELKKFKIISDHAFDAFILMREDGSFAYLNEQALNRWGYTQEEALQLIVSDIDPVYQGEKYKEVFALAQQESIPPFETLHIRKDGSTYPVELSMGGITLDGKPLLFAVARDITERKLADETLRLRNEELQRINNDLDNFIYTASHDLKAPIANIEALLGLLTLGDMQQDEVPYIMNLMQNSVERFKKTIDNLTEVAKLQQVHSGEEVLVDLAQVVGEVQLDLETIIQASRTRLEVVVAACPAIRFLEKNLRSVVYNLLSNAIKYHAPDRTPEVKLSCNRSPQYDVLTVTDNGLGMEAAHLSQLFTMFKRFHDHVEGSGIGLYMVKKIIENAGGYIEVESRIGEGTTFRVYFPR